MYPFSTGAYLYIILSPLILQCIDAAHLLEDVNKNENPGAGASSVPKLAAAIISHILQGHCFSRSNLPSPAFFTDYIFHSLNRTTNLQIIGKFISIFSLLYTYTKLILMMKQNNNHSYIKPVKNILFPSVI